MLTAVFACQPLGQLAATLVALIAAARQRNGIPSDATAQNCNAQCLRTLDSVWRWIIGVGVIPAVIALWFRLTIIESPRYTADVGRDSRKAVSELNRYLLLQAEDGVVSASSLRRPNVDTGDIPLRRRSSASSGAISNADSGAVSAEADINESRGPSPYDNGCFLAPQQTLDGNGMPLPKEIHVTTSQVAAVTTEIPSPRSISPAQYSEVYAGPAPIDQDLEGSQLGDIGDFEAPPPPSWKDFKKYFWHDGNLRTLIATSFCWFCKYSFSSASISLCSTHPNNGVI
jgi:PHS family inorganic phosphate transporter-like MFS transporter